MSKLKRMLANEYVKSLIFLAIILVSIVAFWFGLRTYFRTNFPMLAVASGSMVPTLNVGDLIVVQGGLSVSDVVAEYETGDVIVFHKPGNPDELIVHRAVEKHGSEGNLYLQTKGDHNAGKDPWNIYESDLVGKVVGVIPYFGHVPLFVHTREGMLVIVILIVILVLLEFLIPTVKARRKQD